MFTAKHTHEKCMLLGFVLLSAVTSLPGCYGITTANKAIPANRLDRYFFTEPKDDLCPVSFTSLGQEKPEAHIVGPGDSLSVYVYGVIPATTDETPVLQRFQSLNQQYYPPHGSIVAPTAGIPMTVDPYGDLELPLVGRLPVAGLTIPETIEAIKKAYLAKDVVQQDRVRVSVALIIPRVERIVVLREDTPATNVALLPPGQVDHIHRGSAQVIDLPAYENDVLHALAATGGLPGTDAGNEIWVFRRDSLPSQLPITAEQLGQLAEGYNGEDHHSIVRIPLKGHPCSNLPFAPSDVILDEGDVVYVPRRHNEYFYTGGLLSGARVPLPRDEDIDVIEAIALATGSTGGPLGQSGMALAGGTPGHMVRPTRVIILRELPSGDQIQIRVDLARAMQDEKQRIFIKDGDVVMLHFKPHQAVFNGVLNFVNFNVVSNTKGN
ncbi:MAG: polysaccharide biosynthesis/export family protein [Planctomycetaceae bacterium]|nr:polysaccharide biosynthesis/export family protein [Planctomycetaceae bacterium]